MAVNLNQGEASSYGYQGSQQSGSSVNQSSNWSMSNSWTRSGTDATTAREYSQKFADDAWLKDMYAMGLQMDYNSREAQKQRDWQTKMANTIYTRSVKNMMEAGINPILAYNMGLSGAAVGSGATASLGGIPSAPLAQNFMDSWSAGESASRASGEAYGYSENQGSSWGENWSNSENGLVTALTSIGDLITGIIGEKNSGKMIDNAKQNLDNIFDDLFKPPFEKGKNVIQLIIDGIKDSQNKGGGHGF